MIFLKRNHASTPEKESGFSMLEVLFSIALLSIGLLAISMMQARFVDGNSQSKELIRASDIAMDHIETLTNITNIADPRLALGVNIATDTTYEIDYTLRWVNTDNGDGTYSIDITVSWQNEGITHSVNYPWVKSI